MRPAFDLASVESTIASTRFAGRLQHFATIGSTNVHAVEAAQAGSPAGTVYIADEQTAGRGRGGHSWHSAAGDGLYVSAIVRPALTLADALWIALATGLAAQRAILLATGVAIDIRWPNDLLFGPAGSSRKLGGILVETAAAPDATLRYAVIGIGINVNHAAFPPELAPLATSLRIASAAPQPLSRETLLTQLLLALDDELYALEAELAPSFRGTPPAATLLARFSAASTWVEGKAVRVDEQGGYTGVTAGLDARGFLRVAASDGTLRTVLSGGVRPQE